MFETRSAREPMFNIPGAVVAAVGLLLLVHAARSVLSGVADFRILRDFAFFPAEWTYWFEPGRAEDILRDAAATERPTEVGALARYLLDRGLHPWTPLSYALLHASWAHALLNVVWLAAFGTPVARRCGPLRFALIAVLSAIGGALAQLLAAPTSVMPVVGASAAVSGLMGAAAYFVFTPPYEHDQAPDSSRWQGALGRLVRNRTALIFLAMWFGTNLLFGLSAQPLGIFDGEIAWQAHLGGLLTGLVAFPLVDRWHGRRPGDDV